MANSVEMQAVLTQVAIQAAKAVVRAMREAALPAKPHMRRSISEEQQTRTS